MDTINKYLVYSQYHLGLGTGSVVLPAQITGQVGRTTLTAESTTKQNVQQHIAPYIRATKPPPTQWNT